MENIVLEYSAAEKQVQLASIDKAYVKLETIFAAKPDIEKDLQIQLGSIVSQIYRSALDSTDGFCYKFNLPLVAVQAFYRKIGIPPQKLEEAFRADWKYPKNTHMYSD